MSMSRDAFNEFFRSTIGEWIFGLKQLRDKRIAYMISSPEEGIEVLRRCNEHIADLFQELSDLIHPDKGGKRLNESSGN